MGMPPTRRQAAAAEGAEPLQGGIGTRSDAARKARPELDRAAGDPTYSGHAKRTIPSTIGAGMMEIRQALTFDDVMLVPAASSILPGETDTRTRITREIELGIPLDLGGDGHRDRGRAGDRDGAGRRARRHPPQHADRAAGRRSPQGQEIRGRHGRQPGHDPPGRDPGGRAAADGRAQNLGHSGGRARQPAAWSAS